MNRFGLIDPPAYWNKKTGHFHQIVDTQYVKALAHDLMNKSRSDKVTIDRRGGPAPGGFEIVAAQRIEDSALWERYAKKMREVYERQTVKNLCKVTTTELLTQKMQDSLNPAVNEVYLFHGTSIEGAKGISTTGFRVELAGSSTAAMFGKGAYFAERSTKSDEYVKETRVDIGLSQETHFAMLLCRVCLGELYRITDFDKSAERHVLGSSRYDSLLGDREKVRGTYREFIVYDGAQVYPEYVIIYKRCDQEPRRPAEASEA